MVDAFPIVKVRAVVSTSVSDLNRVWPGSARSPSSRNFQVVARSAVLGGIGRLDIVVYSVKGGRLKGCCGQGVERVKGNRARPSAQDFCFATPNPNRRRQALESDWAQTVYLGHWTRPRLYLERYKLDFDSKVHTSDTAPKVTPASSWALVIPSSREPSVANHLCEIRLRRKPADRLNQILIRFTV